MSAGDLTPAYGSVVRHLLGVEGSCQSDAARLILEDAIVEANVDQFTCVTILAAADKYALFCMHEMIRSILAKADPDSRSRWGVSE